MHDGFDSSRIDYSGQFTERSAFRTSIPEVTLDIHSGNTECSNRVKRMDIEDLEVEIQVLVKRGVEASSTAEQRKVTNDLIRLLTKHKSLFYRSGVKPSCFEEAWTQMLDNFYLNLWEKTTKNAEQTYCDSEGKIVYRLKWVLKKRILDVEQKERGYQKPSKIERPLDNRHRKLIVVSLDAPSQTNQDDDTSLLDRFSLPLEDDSESLASKIARFRELVKVDATEELRNLHIKNRRDLNCQAITLLRFQGVRWEDIATQLGTKTTGSISSFFQRRCIPLLKRLYGEDLGF
jgi:hypothetical protein